MKKITLILTLFGVFTAFGQTTVVTAEEGDGVFSLLRKQGLDPVKYYADFMNLNREKLDDGSELILGKEYHIPDAPDSFKKRALSITNDGTKPIPIFQDELAAIALKSNRLKNAIIYLLPVESSDQPVSSQNTSSMKEQMVKNIAKELIVNGAKVYLIDNFGFKDNFAAIKKGKASNEENAIATKERMQHYVEIINELSLKNSGKYQRMLVINLNEAANNSKYFDISVFHHRKNSESERFAKNLQKVLNKNSIVREQKNDTEVFTNSQNLYLATNVLPPVTMIEIGDTINPGIKERISIASRDEILPNIVTSGVLTDYADISFEEQ